MLPFTAEILFSSFGQYNRALWPLPILAPALALAIVLLTLRPARHGARAIGALMALAWLWVGDGYHFLHFAMLDFTAPVYGALFVQQGLLLAWTGVVRNRLAFRFGPDLFGWCGVALALVAVAWPFADALLGHAWQSVRVAGLAPGPTAAFTLGLLLLTQARTPVHLAVIPLLWTLVAGATAWILAIPQDFALPMYLNLVEPDRDFAHNPLYSANFVLQPPMQPFELAGARLEPVTLDRSEMLSSFAMHLWNSEPRIHGTICYARSAFFESTIDAMVARYTAILERATTEPDTRIDEL